MNALIAEAIRVHLATRGISVEELANMCGWPTHKARSLVSGNRKISSADYGMICKVLNVPVNAFVQMATERSNRLAAGKESKA